MPTYVYIDEKTEEVVELTQAMADSVPIGTVINHEGRALRRVCAGIQGMVEPEWAHVANQIDKDDPDAPKTRDPRTNAPVFKNKREILEYEAKRNARPENQKAGMEWRYDFGTYR